MKNYQNAQNVLNNKNLLKMLKIALLFIIFVALCFYGSILYVKEANAASSNLIIGGSFEGDVTEDWNLWKSNDSVRDFDFYRSYEHAYGYGSYSAVIEATGSPQDRFTAGLVTADANKFTVAEGKNYYLSFYAKSTTPSSVSIYLENAADYSPITWVLTKDITTDWQKYWVIFTLTKTATSSLLTFAFGDLANNNILYLDGVQLVEDNITLVTKEVKGYRGEKNKTLRFSNTLNFTENDISVELPYYDPNTLQVATKKFHPDLINGYNAYISMYDQTFLGPGKVYINDNLVGEFFYNLMVKINNFNLTILRADEDLTIFGTGFSPGAGKTNIIVNVTDGLGHKYEKWIIPHTIDANLSLISATLPVNISSGNMSVNVEFYSEKEAKIINTRSNSMSYKVKPVILSTSWSKKGQDQVGDVLRIYGKGISYNPTVKFYDSSNKKVYSKSAKVVSTDATQEIIEVTTPINITSLKVTVTTDGVESDLESALQYSANPKLTSISSKYYRTISESGEKVQASKVGQEITLKGNALYMSGATTYVEFNGLNGKIKTQINSDKIDPAGKWIKVTVPMGAISGNVCAIVNQQKSNCLILELIPAIQLINPQPIIPGDYAYIVATGIGSNISLTKVYFLLNNNTEVAVNPESITVNWDTVTIKARTPLAMANNTSSVVIQYDKWRDDGKIALNIPPHINYASINMDNKVLTITGYGFSMTTKENIITYKYADGTVITPKVKVLGVYITDQGQEIRIQILDSYYYGKVSVKVGENTSNEAEFGPVVIKSIARRVEYVKSESRVMGVLYISGYNFGSKGGVKVGDVWADIHYRSNFFIIAVVDKEHVYDNPVIVAKE